jgi:hypothetical protein
VNIGESDSISTRKLFKFFGREGTFVRLVGKRNFLSPEVVATAALSPYRFLWLLHSEAREGAVES